MDGNFSSRARNAGCRRACRAASTPTCGVSFHLPQTRYRATDNFFDLYPNVPHTVRISLNEPMAASALQARLTTMSFVESY
jgi:hypothetical protein